MSKRGPEKETETHGELDHDSRDRKDSSADRQPKSDLFSRGFNRSSVKRAQPKVNVALSFREKLGYIPSSVKNDVAKYLNNLYDSLEGDDDSKQLVQKLQESLNAELSFREKISRLITFSKSHNEKEISRLAERLFPDEMSTGLSIDQATIPVPTMPPVRWVDRRSLEVSPPNGTRWTPPDFIRHVYGPWIGRGLTRAHIRNDHALSVALDRWLTKNPMPGDIDLPVQSVLTDRTLESVEEMRADGIEPTFSIKESARILSAQHYRGKKR